MNPHIPSSPQLIIHLFSLSPFSIFDDGSLIFFAEQSVNILEMVRKRKKIHRIIPRRDLGPQFTARSPFKKKLEEELNTQSKA